MALIKCPECGHQVSDTADTCPECGFCISQFIYEEKIKAKRRAIQSAPPKDDSWVKPLKKYVMKPRKIYFWLLNSSLLLSLLFLILLITITNLPFIILFTIFLVTLITFIPLFLSHRKDTWKIFKEEGSTIFFFERGYRYGLYVDNDLANDIDEGFISYRLPSGSIVYAGFDEMGDPLVWVEDFSKFEAKPNTRTKTIVNNYVTNNITKTSQRGERSDMEKILIKNAKIDALASIDPTDTKKAKEQIDIVNKLDDLD